jgi:GDPmannose 4,6-dehydratase
VHRTAVITGIAGQDGSYLAELLLTKGYRVVGVGRDIAGSNYRRVKHVPQDIEMATGNLLDQASLVRLLDKFKPDEVYNLAAHSFLPDHKTQPEITAEVAALGVIRLLEAVRTVDPRIRFFQASSSEMFGRALQVPQSETTPFRPQNLYAIAKVYAHSVTAHYRETHEMFTCCGILFNHESPRRNIQFVTRKVTSSVARIELGRADKLYLGNLDARRDWGYAVDFVRGMWLMLQQDVPDDYVLATGETHSVRELCEVAFSHFGLDYRQYVVEDARFVRPAEDTLLVGDPTKAARVLGWKPTISFHELISLMVESDMKAVSERSDA